jgi:hypothetical protein
MRRISIVLGVVNSKGGEKKRGKKTLVAQKGFA